MKRIYIAGPMTNLPGFNFPAFFDAAEKLRAQGHHVENPAEHGVIPGHAWEDYMRMDIAQLVTCDAIYLLPGWSKSRGATIEHRIATDLGLEIMEAV